MNARAVFVVILGVAALVALWAGRSGASPSAAPRTVVVKMTDGLQFLPVRVTVRVGDRVIWRNVGRIAHTVTTLRSKASNPAHARVPKGAKAWDSKFIFAKKTYARRFTVPGIYRYFCIPHEGAGMVGTVVVKR